MSIPFTRPGVWPGGSPPHGIATRPDGCEVALVGLPDDTGVALNFGRPGAREGPTAFRAALARLGFESQAVARGSGGRGGGRGGSGEGGNDSGGGRALFFDAGDVVPAEGGDAAALHETHDRVTEVLLGIHEAGMLPVCIGGGHDLTFPSVRGWVRHRGGIRVGGISVDAHLDVRERVGSGMGFRALIEGEFLDPERFTVLGTRPGANSAEHLAWLSGVGGTVVDEEEVRSEPACVGAAFERARSGDGSSLFMSFDLDVLPGAEAPGVSAVNPSGLDLGLVISIAERAGRDPAVGHLDIVELSPPHDDGGRTARHAAALLLAFLRARSGSAG